MNGNKASRQESLAEILSFYGFSFLKCFLVFKLDEKPPFLYYEKELKKLMVFYIIIIL